MSDLAVQLIGMKEDDVLGTGGALKESFVRERTVDSTCPGLSRGVLADLDNPPSMTILITRANPVAQE